MAKKLETGTSKGTRIAIWAILAFTVISTVALYASSFLNIKNQASDQKKKQEKYTAFQKAEQERQKKVSVLADELSAKYYDTFKEYEKYPKAFNAANLKEMKTEDFKVGDGEEITDNTTEFYAYYIGWKSDGTVFDSSFQSGKLGLPLAVKKTGDKWGVIEGWSEGIQGMKIGGIRELSIPADKAYGEAGVPNSQDNSKSIDPNEPLKFVIMLVPKYEEIPEVDIYKYFTKEELGQ